MNLNVISDTHIGVIRTGGTTPRTAWQLRQYLLNEVRKLLMQIDGPLLINGDWFDTYNVPYTDLFESITMLQEWLRKGHPLYLSEGNHDRSKTTATMSSFQFLGRLFASDPAVTYIADEGQALGEDAWVIPHVANQDLFDIELSKVPKVKQLFLHSNVNNKFAQQSDHSLNLSYEQAEKLPVDHIILGHEHQRSSHLAGKVVVVGNQVPSSVADCLGNDAKYYLRITDNKLEHIPVWTRESSFERVDWREALTAPTPTAQFIRVEGDATPAEAPAAVSAISKLRSTHEAFVITNAVQITERDSKGEKLTLEQIQGYDVLTALMKRLTPEQGAAVNQLLEAENG